jgi:acyl-CoA synthetase (AMP-forming)/AMP-acid ligase II
VTAAGSDPHSAWSLAGWRAHLPGTTDIAGQVRALGEHTIPELAAIAASAHPDRTAVSVDDHVITHAELDAGSAAVAAWLASRTDPGEGVLLAASPGPGFLCCYLGAMRAGVIIVLASPAATAAELAHLAADSGAALAFVDERPRSLLRGQPGLRSVAPAAMVPPGPAGPGGRRQPDMPDPDDVAVLAYTSGTTGRPKGVPLTHRQLATSIRAAMAAWQWSQQDVVVHALPLDHQHGLGGIHATLIAGGTAHVTSRFRPGDLIGLARHTRASILLGVPTIYQALYEEANQHINAATPQLGGLRLAMCGSAPLSPALAARLPALLGGLPLIRYGTTETGLDVSNVLGRAAADTVGVPLPGVLARIVPSGDGHAAPAVAGLGTQGEIQLRGPQVFSGYWHDSAADAAAFTADGWFRTGDIGQVDQATGQLVIVGRTKELIISGGLNVYPREIELVLENHPSVSEAAVAGLPHERWGEQVTAWVVIRPGDAFSEDELIGYARTMLTAYKCPKRIYRLTELPRNHLGKLIRADLSAP